LLLTRKETMTRPRGKVFTFAKVVTVLAIVFVVSLG
jgi:hypothetical protein